METIEIVQISPKDIDLFYTIFTQTIESEFPEYSEKMKTHFLTRPLSYTKENMKHWITTESNVGFVAFVDTRPVGFLFGRSVDLGVAFLNWLGVLKPYQKKGVGKKLLNAWESLVKNQGAHVIHVYTFERNLPFYEKCGYTTLALDKKAWFGIDTYILRKHMQEPKEENYLR